MKPTQEQLEAVLDVCHAMNKLSSLWDEEFNNIFMDLDPEVTEDLMTMSYDELGWKWGHFYEVLKEVGYLNE